MGVPFLRQVGLSPLACFPLAISGLNNGSIPHPWPMTRYHCPGGQNLPNIWQLKKN